MPRSKAVPIASVDADAATRVLTGVGELDRVLGAGLVPGAVVLLAGEPGVGKSTLLLEVASRWAKADRPTLYVTGEESAAQVRLRAGRTDALADDLFLAAETDLGTVLGHIEEVNPSLLVVDSVQTIGAAEADGSPGGVTQVREVTGALVRVAKRTGMAVILVGHVTKDGAIAGPRLLEHLVDVVLAFDGDKHSGFRMVRATKNRYGPADEVGCFEMAEHGIVEVPDPSGLFLSRHDEPVPGTASRSPWRAGGRCWPRSRRWWRRLRCRRRGGSSTGSTPGGWRWCWPCCSAGPGCRSTTTTSTSRRWAERGCSTRPRIWPPRSRSASTVRNESIVRRFVAIGEVGLAGELRRVPGLDRRLAEAARLGFTEAVIPADSGSAQRPDELVAARAAGARGAHHRARAAGAVPARRALAGSGQERVG